MLVIQDKIHQSLNLTSYPTTTTTSSAASDALLKLFNHHTSKSPDKPNNHKKQLSFNFTYEMASEERRKIFPPLPNSVVMDWRKTSDTQTSHSPITTTSLQKNQEEVACTISTIPDTSSACDTCSKCREREGIPSICPSFEATSLESHSIRTHKNRSRNDVPLKLSSKPLRSQSVTDVESNHSSLTKAYDSSNDYSSTTTNQSKSSRRRRRKIHNDALSMFHIVDESSACDTNLASFRHLMSLKSSLEYSMDIVPHPAIPCHDIPIFPVLPTSTALIILFPKIQTFSKVHRTYYICHLKYYYVQHILS